MIIQLSSIITMGLVLGLLGGGGSLLSIPILVYLFKFSATDATTYSLAIVGFSSLIAVFRYQSQELIHWTVALMFAIPSIIGVLIARVFLLPAIPQYFSLGNFFLTKDQFVLLFFSCLVLSISYFMFTSKDQSETTSSSLDNINYLLICFEGFIVGIVTGLVGAGGGFMIVPTLTLLTKISLRAAIATSLLIICSKSLFGFCSDILYGFDIDWIFLATFLSITLFATVIGTVINKHVPVSLLRKTFAIFVLLMGIIIFMKEFPWQTQHSYKKITELSMQEKEISIVEFIQLTNSNQRYKLIDVRELEEYQESHIEGAELIPLGQIHQHLDSLNKDDLYIMQCRSGRRSATAQQYLKAQGFERVFNLQGGILAWDDYHKINKD